MYSKDCFKRVSRFAVIIVAALLSACAMPGHKVTFVADRPIVATFAGIGGTAGYADGRFAFPGTGAAASFAYPMSVRFDGAGNLFVLAGGDGNSITAAIREMTPDGRVSTVAGPGSWNDETPSDMAVAPDGTMYVTTQEGEVYKVTPQGVGTVFSTGIYTYCQGIALDGTGNVYVADADAPTITEVSSSGTVLQTFTFSDNGHPNSIAVDSSGALYATRTDNTVWRFTSPTSETQIWSGDSSFLNGIAVDATGNVYVSEANVIKKLTYPSYTSVSTWVGSGSSNGNDGPSGFASLSLAQGIAFDHLGNLYVADSGIQTVRKVSADGTTVTTVAGTRMIGSQNGWAVVAAFRQPKGVAFDASGAMYVSDTGNNVIRKLSTDGTVSTVTASVGVLSQPESLAIDSSGTLYVNDVGSARILKIASGTVTSVWSYSGQVNGLVVARDNSLYVADFDSNVVHHFAPSGTELTHLPLADDGPYYLAMDSSGNVFASGGNNSVYKITPQGQSSKYATTPALVGLAFDSSSNLYGVDPASNQILKITSAGQVFSFVTVSSGLSSPSAIVFRTDSFYLADSGNDVIRKISSR